MTRRIRLLGGIAAAAVALVLVAPHTALAGPVPPVGDWPVVAITSPLNNNPTYPAPATVPITAFAATAPGSTITKVEFYAQQWVNQQVLRQLIGTDTTAPYTVTWTGVSAGVYQLVAWGRMTTPAGEHHRLRWSRSPCGDRSRRPCLPSPTSLQ